MNIFADGTDIFHQLLIKLVMAGKRLYLYFDSFSVSLRLPSKNSISKSKYSLACIFQICYLSVLLDFFHAHNNKTALMRLVSALDDVQIRFFYNVVGLCV